MKRFWLVRRRDPVAGLSWNFEEIGSDRPDSGLSWHFEESPSDGPVAGLSWHFEEAVRNSAPTDIPPSVAMAHIGAAAKASRGAPFSNPAQPEAAVSSLRAAVRRRRFALGGLMSSVTAKVLLGTMTALAATGGAAAANVLPDPVQAVVADLAGVVGIDLPSPDDDRPAAVVTDDDDPLDETGEKPPAEDPVDDDAVDEGDDDSDDQGDDGVADDQDDDDQGDDGVADDQGDNDQGDNDQGGDDQGDNDQGDNEQ